MPIPPFPPVPPAQVLYDFLMGKIEPDLTSNQLPLLKQKYQSETPEEKKERKKRYGKAMQQFDIAFAEYIEHYNQAVHRYKKTALQLIEQRTRSHEEADFDALLQQELPSS
jgi:hypothetical protein